MQIDGLNETMSCPNLPDFETAKGMSFDEIAKAINVFIAEAKKNNSSVSRGEIEALVEVLYDKAPQVPPHPGPKPVAPPPPPDSKYSEPDLWLKYEKDKQEWIKFVYLPWQDAAYQNYQVLKLLEHRIIKGIRSEIHKLLPTGRWAVTRKVNWVILPPGDWPIDESSVASLFAGKSAKAIIPERLVSAVKLSPTEIVSGTSEFNEYLCFRFRNTDKVLLESPYEGNAAYILRGDWESLSKKTKSELTDIYAEFCERIIHGESGNWKHEIKSSLRL